MGNTVDKPIKDLGKEVEFSLNGTLYKVGNDFPGDISLNAFIREKANLHGTKFMCLEGGCGACVVTAEFDHPVSHKKVIAAVNSCLVPLYSCHGWKVTTIDGIGNTHKGYHEMQKRLAAASGTQCGYCTPGMIMNMYSLFKKNPKLTMKEIENSFGGNICRCTGYRPILDAFKSFAIDAPKELTEKLTDIEDMLICTKSGEPCKGDCDSKCNNDQADWLVTPKPLVIDLIDGSQWYRPTSTKEVFEIMYMTEGKSYRLVAGNTGQGVYRIKQLPQIYIDLNGISALHDWNAGYYSLSLGANLSLTEAIDIFTKEGQAGNNYSYCLALAKHIDLIANVPVRNMGTLAGNIFLKYCNREFPSDLFLIFETVGAKICIESNSGVENEYFLMEFLEMGMNNKLITKFNLPALDKDKYIVKTYKIMPRAQNAHAYVNAGFKFKFDKKSKYRVLEQPSIVFGGISPNFVHAKKTEAFLNGHQLLDPNVLKKALDILNGEINPDHVLPDASPQYRKGLAMSLFYKFVLSLDPQSVNPLFRSGGLELERPISSGKQDFDTNKKDWPVNKPIPKVDGLIQCAGEAEYSNDYPNQPGQVWCQLVLCDKGGATISKINTSEALAMPGVIAFYGAKDFSGINTFIPPNNAFNAVKEKVFADGRTDYAGQAVGIIVAESHTLAIRAAQKVKISYSQYDEVIIDPLEIIKKQIKSRITELARMNPTGKKDNIKYKINGKSVVPSQYHFTMETHTCVAVPKEDMLEVYTSTQWPGCVHEAISNALNMPQHRINLYVRRLGGGYGSKITLNAHTAAACSLVAVKLYRPARLVLNLETNMEWAGKRPQVFSDYEAGVDENGVIQYLNMKLYEDIGYSPNDNAMGGTISFLPSCYDQSTWSVVGYGVKTDKASNTWCRAPGSTEAVAIMENIMEHIAKVVKKDPTSVRIANMTKDNLSIKMISDIKMSSSYDSRMADVVKFNKENRWKKRGISLVPIEYRMDFGGNFYGSVTIFRNDGTVALAHSAVEMGQGCNTKATQVAANILGVPLENIHIKPIDINVFPNSFVTGGSMGSESACYAIIKACEEMNKKLEPIKQNLGPSATWKDIILAADTAGVELRSQYMLSQTVVKREGYRIFGVSVIEVELDILTGQHQILRLDVIEDAGQSLSPDVDVGQVEGAMVMGLGLFTSEELVYDNKIGTLLTNRTWNYKPPGAKDIPIDFRITLLKNASNPVGVFRSKATGEPPLNLSVNIVFAIKSALESARRDAGKPPDEWMEIELPLTTEKTWLNAANDKSLFTL